MKIDSGHVVVLVVGVEGGQVNASRRRDDVRTDVVRRHSVSGRTPEATRRSPQLITLDHPPRVYIDYRCRVLAAPAVLAAMLADRNAHVRPVVDSALPVATMLSTDGDALMIQ